LETEAVESHCFRIPASTLLSLPKKQVRPHPCSLSRIFIIFTTSIQTIHHLLKNTGAKLVTGRIQSITRFYPLKMMKFPFA